MKIINKYWHFLILAILCLIPLIWFYNKGSSVLITGLDTNFPLNPLVWFTRRFFVWNSTVNAGGDFSSSTSGLFFHLIQTIPYLLNFSLRNVEILTLIFWFSCIVISTYVAAKIVVPKNRMSQIAIVLFYSINIYLFNTWENIKVSNLSLYVSLPFFISILHFLINKKITYINSIIFFVLGSVIASGSGINPAYFSVLLLCITFFCVLEFISNKDKKRTATSYFVAVFTILLVNSFWIFPLLSYLFSNRVGNVVDLGYTNWLDSLSQNTSLINVIRLQGAWDWYALNSYGMPEYLPYALNYLYKSPFIVFSFVPGIISLFSLLFYQKDKKIWYAFFGFLMLLGIFLGAGSHYPTGQLFTFLVKHIPFFSFYRSPWYIFTPFLTLSYAFLTGLLIENVHFNLKQKFRIVFYGILFIFFISYCFYNYPLISGKIFRPNRKDGFYITFPDYVFKANDWLANNDSFSKQRIFSYPDDQMENFNWGYRGTDSILNLFSDKEIITPAFNVQSQEFQKILDKIYKYLKEKEYKTAFSILDVFAVDTIFNKKDTSTLSPELDFSNQGLNLKNFDEWQFISIPSSQNKIFIPQNVYADYSSDNSFITALPELEKSYAVLNGISDTQVDLIKNKENYLKIIGLNKLNTEDDNWKKYSFQINKKGDYTFVVEKDFVEPSSVRIKIDGITANRILTKDNGGYFTIGPVIFDKGEHVIELYFPRPDNLISSNYDDLITPPDLKKEELPIDLKKTLVIFNDQEIEKEIKIPVASFNPFISYIVEMDYKYFYGSVPIIDIVQSAPTSPVKTYPMKLGSSSDWEHIKEIFNPVSTDSKLEIVFKLPAKEHGDRSKMFVENISVKRIYKNNIALIENNSKNAIFVPELTFNKVSPTKYEVKVSNVSNPYILVFLETYSKQWNIKMKNGETINNMPHFKVNGYANGWYIPNSENYQEFVISYKPQGLFTVGFTVFVSVTIIFLVLSFLAFRKKR